jgi:ABC-type polysaccharide/polyol phosphate export permease
VLGYLSRVWKLRYFWWALVRIDLRKRYRGSAIGMGWSLLQPIAMTAVLCTVFSQIFHAEVRTYAPFLLAGLTVWNFITTVMMQGCQCFFGGEAYIRQHPAPLAIYPLRVTLGASVHLVLGILVVLSMAWCLHGFSNLRALIGLVPALVLLLVFGWSLGICTGVVNVLFQDTMHLTEILLQILFYLTPILYSADLLRQRHLAWFLGMNPMAAFLDLVREPILEGRFPSWEVFALAGAGALLPAAGAALLLSRIERRLVFYL